MLGRIALRSAKGLGRAALPAASKQFLPNTMMYTLATAGYVPFVLNLHESMKRVGIAEHLVAFTPNEAVKNELSAYGLQALSFGTEALPDCGKFWTPEFAQIVALKFAVGIEILTSGKNALFIDSDIVFLRNPVDYLLELISQSTAQMIMQYESPKNVYNTGFWFARPHPAVVQIFEDICKCLVNNMYFDDQTCFNELMRGNDQIRVEPLNARLFACGNQFLGELSGAPEVIDQSMHPFDFASAYILHFNYVLGTRAKVNAMKECNSLFYSGLFGSPGGKRSIWERLKASLRRAS
jgi:hypothetical protein